MFVYTGKKSGLAAALADSLAKNQVELDKVPTDSAGTAALRLKSGTDPALNDKTLKLLGTVTEQVLSDKAPDANIQVVSGWSETTGFHLSIT